MVTWNDSKPDESESWGGNDDQVDPVTAAATDADVYDAYDPYATAPAAGEEPKPARLSRKAMEG